MKLYMNNAESERKKNIEFAKEHGISEEKIEEVYQTILSELPEDLTGDRREARALRKARNSFKKQINANGKIVDGFILMRFRNNDFEINAWNKIDEYVQEHGIEEATKNKMVDSNGNYLHTPFTTNFSQQHGKKIDKNNIRGSAIAIVVQEDDNGNHTQELRWLNIGRYNINDSIPLCREVSLIIKEGQRPGPLYPDRNAYFVNGVKDVSPNAYYSDDDFQAYADLVEKLCGDVAYYSKEEIDKLALEGNNNQKTDFIAVPVMSVSNINPPNDSGFFYVDFELEDDQIHVGVPEYIFKDLTLEEGIQGILFMNTYRRKDKDTGELVPGYMMGGFLPLMS